MSGDIREVNWTAAIRPATWCVGCGYHRPAHGAHRLDCTDPNVIIERRTAVIAAKLAELDHEDER